MSVIEVNDREGRRVLEPIEEMASIEKNPNWRGFGVALEACRKLKLDWRREKGWRWNRGAWKRDYIRAYVD